MNEEIIQNIKLEDDMILAVDENEVELLRFQFTFDNCIFKFKAPTYRQHRILLINYARIITELANIFPQLIYPDLELLKNENKWFDWKKITSKAFSSRTVIKLIEKTLIMLLDIPKNGNPIFSLYKRLKYIRLFKNKLNIFQMQKLFAFMISIEDIVKKNLAFHLEKIYNLPQKTSTPKPTSCTGSTKTTDGKVQDFIMLPSYGLN